MPTRPARRPGLLVAVEGIDGAGTAAVANLLARWIERRGRRVHVVAWEASAPVRRAAADGRTRQSLTPRVAALLVAAEAHRRADELVKRQVDAGDIVIADRYAWTGVARDHARGLDPDWIAGLYERLPAPAVVVLVQERPDRVIGRTIDERLGPGRAEAVAPAFRAFLAAVAAGLDDLAAGRVTAPWPARTVVLELGEPLDDRLASARDAIRAVLDDDGSRAA
ncbi:MAG TPA: hypothetical protein VFR14_13780 [Candidatus Limnocylindrales bacterium]|nr:hypothetical protein [Candidatus Limnocylindrales bacterium]